MIDHSSIDRSLRAKGIPKGMVEQIIDHVTQDSPLGEAAFRVLFEYYCCNGMPYGVAKARDGDPDVWIKQALKEEWSIKEWTN